MFRYICITILIIELIGIMIMAKNEPLDEEGGIALGFIIMLFGIVLPLIYIILH